MKEYKLKTGKVGEKIVETYQKIENATVNGYQAIEDAVVGAYKKVEDKFVEKILEPVDDNKDAAKQQEEK